MKLLIKLAIAALLVHGSWRAGTVYWRYYQFKDEVQATAQYSGATSENELQARVLEIAAALQVPVEAERIEVRRAGNHTLIDAAYMENIEIVPTYFYPWEFKVNVDVFTVAMPAKASDPFPGQ